MTDARQNNGSHERRLSDEDSQVVSLRQHEVYENAFTLLSTIAAVDPELVRQEEMSLSAEQTQALPEQVTADPKLANQVAGSVINFAAAKEQQVLNAQQTEAERMAAEARRLIMEARNA
ncbi:MAG TPA: hypothetical protein VLG13_01860 [Patescibacteria group bacterium]|nr:hypothetical protein [Patescibacteria group bacterium]